MANKPAPEKVSAMTAALHCAHGSTQRLQDALKLAKEAEGLLILGLIEQQANLTRRIEHVRDAMSIDARGER